MTTSVPPMYIPPVLPTIKVPRSAKQPWHIRPHFHCTCGFAAGAHPYCHCCGLIIGPEHAQVYGANVPFDVYADVLNEQTGDWEIVRQVRDYTVCGSCNLRIKANVLTPDPVRLESHTRERAAGTNAWKRRHKINPEPLFNGRNTD